MSAKGNASEPDVLAHGEISPKRSLQQLGASHVSGASPTPTVGRIAPASLRFGVPMATWERENFQAQRWSYHGQQG